MTRAYVLMTAMPPTRGHLHLIQFAARIADSAEVILATQPDEPYVFERLDALREVTKDMNVNIHHIHKTLPQEPEGAGDSKFWDMWLDFLHMFGLTSDDFIVASESYGLDLARISGATFMPYDVGREIYYSKATDVRNNPRDNFDQVLPEFQPTLRQRVTIFGAESCGKTTLTKEIAPLMNGHWLFEYARPYLETVITEANDESMHAIWRGQRALQLASQEFLNRPFIFQDTDLFSTVGYWDFSLGDTPQQLVADALADQSDLYIICPSNIPFEPDPIRFGGDRRESDDQFWIDLCEKHGLNYMVLTESGRDERRNEARAAIEAHYDKNVHIGYKRSGAEYANSDGN